MQPDQILRRLEAEGQKVLLFLDQLEDGDWEQAIYSDGEVWKIHQILAHFVSVERAFLWLTDNIVSGGSGAPEGFDLDRFNHEQVANLQAQSRQDLIEAFREGRAATIRQASHYGLDDLQQEGNHPWFGQVSVAKLLKLLYRHNQLHLRDIRRQISSADPPAA